MQHDLDLFAPAPRRAPGKPRVALSPATRTLAPAPRRCVICGAFGPFGKGDVRRPESIIWACGEHRRHLG